MEQLLSAPLLLLLLFLLPRRRRRQCLVTMDGSWRSFRARSTSLALRRRGRTAASSSDSSTDHCDVVCGHYTPSFLPSPRGLLFRDSLALHSLFQGNCTPLLSSPLLSSLRTFLGIISERRRRRRSSLFCLRMGRRVRVRVHSAAQSRPKVGRCRRRRRRRRRVEHTE